jgi:hypothetical protein
MVVAALGFLGVEGAVDVEKGWGFATRGNSGVHFEIDASCIDGVDRYERCWGYASSPKVLQEETPSTKPVYT